MVFPRQEYWSGLPFPSPEGLADLGIEPISLKLAGEFFFFYHCVTSKVHKPYTPSHKDIELIINKKKKEAQLHHTNNWHLCEHTKLCTLCYRRLGMRHTVCPAQFLRSNYTASIFKINNVDLLGHCNSGKNDIALNKYNWSLYFWPAIYFKFSYYENAVKTLLGIYVGAGLLLHLRVNSKKLSMFLMGVISVSHRNQWPRFQRPPHPLHTKNDICLCCCFSH